MFAQETLSWTNVTFCRSLWCSWNHAFWRVVNAQRASTTQAKYNVTWRATANLLSHPFPVLLWCVWDFLPCPPVPHYLVCLMSVFSRCPLPVSCESHVQSAKKSSLGSRECFFVRIHCRQSSIHVFYSSASRYVMKDLNTCVPVLKSPLNKEYFFFIKLGFVKFDWLISSASFHLLIIITCFNQNYIKTG